MKTEILSDYCYVEARSHCLTIGDDNRMNEILDSPAVIRTQAEALKLIAWLQKNMTQLPVK